MNPDSSLGRPRLRHETHDTSQGDICFALTPGPILSSASNQSQIGEGGGISQQQIELCCHWKIFRSDKDFSAISDHPLLAAGLAGLGCIRK